MKQKKFDNSKFASLEAEQRFNKWSATQKSQNKKDSQRIFTIFKYHDYMIALCFFVFIWFPIHAISTFGDVFSTGEKCVRISEFECVYSESQTTNVK